MILLATVRCELFACCDLLILRLTSTMSTIPFTGDSRVNKQGKATPYLRGVREHTPHCKNTWVTSTIFLVASIASVFN